MEDSPIVFAQFGTAPRYKWSSSIVGEMRGTKTILFTVDRDVPTQPGAHLHKGIK
jgi:hypothetical protein